MGIKRRNNQERRMKTQEEKDKSGKDGMERNPLGNPNKPQLDWAR